MHLTDTHIMAGGKWQARSGAWEFDTTASLRQVIDAVNTLEPRPAFAVLGGDLASPDLLDHHRVWTPEEYESSYILLQELLRALPCPTYMLIGHHDNRVAFHRIFGNAVSAPDTPHYYSFDYHLCPVVESLTNSKHISWPARLSVDPGQRPGAFHACLLSP